MLKTKHGALLQLTYLLSLYLRKSKSIAEIEILKHPYRNLEAMA